MSFPSIHRVFKNQFSPNLSIQKEVIVSISSSFFSTLRCPIICEVENYLLTILQVYFIDLDLKPMKKMEEYYELDKKIVSLYRKIEKGKVGDISNAKFYESKVEK